MTIVNDTWRFLVQRRLWPVAILLVAAAAAIPFLLGDESAPPPAAPAVAVKSADSTLATEPIVVPASDGDRAGRRHVLGSPKNPFKPNATPTPVPKTDVAATQTGGDTAPAGGSDTGGTTSSPGATTPSLPGATTPLAQATPKKKTYELYELTVRFGPSADTRPSRKDVKRLQALPSNEEPVLIYLGVLEDKKTAVFMVDSGVIAQGDGSCRPSPGVCETIHIREGETEFLDVAGEEGEATDEASGTQYQLDVLKIRKTTTTNAGKAKAAKARVSLKGRQIVRARIAGDGPLRYRYDKKSGRLHKLTKKAYKAVVAEAAKAARAHF
jgi:hypothetical protein